MKILITGSSGMLGSELCRALGEDNEVIGMDVASPRSTAYSPMFFYEASITEPEEVKKVFARAVPDVVIHAAAWTDVDGCELDPGKAYLMNTSGTEILAEAASLHGAPLIFMSTDFVFDGAKKRPYREDDQPKPLSVYGDTKWKAEEAVKKRLRRFAILRTSWLYGRNGRNFVDTILAKARTDRTLKVVNDQVGSPTNARELAMAIAALIKSQALKGRGIFHVCNSGKCAWHEFASAAVKYAGMAKDVQVRPITSEELGRPAKRPAYSVMDNARFRRASGFRMRKWEEALEDYVKNWRVW